MEEGEVHPTGYKFPTRSHTAMGEMGEGDRKQTQSVLANWADTSFSSCSYCQLVDISFLSADAGNNCKSSSWCTILKVRCPAIN